MSTAPLSRTCFILLGPRQCKVDGIPVTLNNMLQNYVLLHKVRSCSHYPAKSSQPGHMWPLRPTTGHNGCLMMMMVMTMMICNDYEQNNILHAEPLVSSPPILLYIHYIYIYIYGRPHTGHDLPGDPHNYITRPG